MKPYWNLFTISKEQKERVWRNVTRPRNKLTYGDKIGNTVLHSRVNKIYPIVKNCQICQTSNKALELANITGIYKPELYNWAKLCVSCHRKFDDPTMHKWIAPHLRIIMNVYF
jgi:hypothetical protein